MLIMVGVVLSINTMMLYRVREFVHEAEVYFYCLQVRYIPLQQISLEILLITKTVGMMKYAV